MIPRVLRSAHHPAPWFFLACLLLGIAGCASFESTTGTQAEVIVPGQPSQQGSPAVVALLDRAAAQESAGYPELSAATLERALRIDPRNPWLWHRLARVRLEMGMAQRAENLAIKSNFLAQGNERLLRENWRLIAAARSSQGDTEGAEQAQREAANYGR